MKLLMTVLDTRIKNKASKVKLKGLAGSEAVFSNFLAKNPYFKSVKQVSFNVTLCGKTKIKSLSIDKLSDASGIK